MSSEMIERAAQAMATAEGWRWEDDKQMLDCAAAGLQHTSRERDTWRNRARATIETMRSLSKEMVIAGNSKIDECIDFWNYDSGSGYTVEQHAAFETWNAMIDAALATPAPARGE